MLLVLFIALLILRTECAKILGVFPAQGYSQFILAEVLMKELANRGHEVTVIAAYKPKNEPQNYRTILLDDILQTLDSSDLFDLASSNLFINIKTTYIFGKSLTEKTLKNKQVQELLHSNEQFDLVIVEQFFNDAMKGFASHFEAPLVLFSSMGITEWNKEYMGNPMLPSLNAVTYTDYTNHMKFFQRIRNLIGNIYDYLYRHFVFYPIQKEFLKQYFPKPMNFDEIVNNGSIMLLNSHVTTSENTLLLSNMIEIGGFHVTQNPLDQELQQFLDNATDGAIFFSLGSNLRSCDLSEDFQRGIFRIFRKLKHKVLWKFEKDIPNKPNNIFISKWFNQRDILAHPNIKLFITHGGLLSTTEGIFNGIPMVGIPVFADQAMNIARAKKNGIATMIPFSKLTEDNLFEAINETLSNPSYQINAKRIANLIKDRPMKPLDLAVYWIEHTIRHKGFRFDPSTMQLYWFEIYMIDILLFVMFNFIVVFLLFKFLCKFFNKTQRILDKNKKD